MDLMNPALFVFFVRPLSPKFSETSILSRKPGPVSVIRVLVAPPLYRSRLQPPGYTGFPKPQTLSPTQLKKILVRKRLAAIKFREKLTKIFKKRQELRKISPTWPAHPVTEEVLLYTFSMTEKLHIRHKPRSQKQPFLSLSPTTARMRNLLPLITRLNMTASIPAGELPVVPARIPHFRELFPLRNDE
jgi:hypothetical protein